MVMRCSAGIVFTGMILEASPYGIMGHSVLYTMPHTIFAQSAPCFVAHDELNGGIIHQVIEP